jgi:hypothetical protein
MAERCQRIVRRLSVSALVILMLVREAPGSAVCEVSGEEGARTVWREIQSTCECTSAANRRAYRRCAFGVMRSAMRDGRLGESCRAALRQCVTKSTCGRPGYLLCYREKNVQGGQDRSARRHGVCRLQRDAGACSQRHTGVALLVEGSCCDLCMFGECTSPASTTTTSVTPSTVRSNDSSSSTTVPAGSTVTTSTLGGPCRLVWLGPPPPTCGGECPPGEACVGTLVDARDRPRAGCECRPQSELCLGLAVGACTAGRCPSPVEGCTEVAGRCGCSSIFVGPP